MTVDIGSGTKERSLAKKQRGDIAAFQKYTKGQQTLNALAKERGVTSRTMRKRFDGLTVVTGECIIKKMEIHP